MSCAGEQIVRVLGSDTYHVELLNLVSTTTTILQQLFNFAISGFQQHHGSLPKHFRWTSAVEQRCLHSIVPSKGRQSNRLAVELGKGRAQRKRRERWRACPTLEVEIPPRVFAGQWRGLVTRTVYIPYLQRYVYCSIVYQAPRN